MLSRLLHPNLLCLAIVAALAACSLNPQPEPPLSDRGPDAAWGVGGAACAGEAGSGGGTFMDASQEPLPPSGDAGADTCTNCDCNCYAGGECEAGADACPCEAGDAGDADVEPDSDQDAVAQD